MFLLALGPMVTVQQMTPAAVLCTRFVVSQGSGIRTTHLQLLSVQRRITELSESRYLAGEKPECLPLFDVAVCM